MTNINIRTDEKVKEDAEKLFESLGLNLSVAINVFLRQAIREQRIPFNLTLEVPNQTTLNAFNEARSIAKDSSIKGYKDTKSLRDALEV
ncbi:MAG: type II toxin-antitoxin system RelB/DinJ family antitoxin [Christensenellales bacterium]